MKPRIDRTNLKQTTLKVGKGFKFDVNIKGEPAPTVTWLLADKQVESQDNVEIINVDYNTKLSVNDARRKNSGIYKIIAVNEHGRDEADVEVLILGAPSKPKGPLKVSDVTKNGLKLAWAPPEDDGGKPVTGYVVEKLDKGRWVQVGRTKDTDFDVTGLQEGKEYSFRVRAVNEEGESENLEADKPVIAKNPFGMLFINDIQVEFVKSLPSMLTIFQKDPAGKPGTPEIVDWDVDRVDLKWTAPKSNGGVPITGYVIEKKERYGSTWEEILTTQVTLMTKFTWQSLPHPHTNYCYLMI